MIQQCAKFHRKSMTSSISRESPLMSCIFIHVLFIRLFFKVMKFALISNTRVLKSINGNECFLSRKMIILKLNCHPFINDHGDLPFLMVFSLVIGTRKIYFKEKKIWIVEVVVFTCKSRETAFRIRH